MTDEIDECPHIMLRQFIYLSHKKVVEFILSLLF
jgi:hypothetical protein